MGGVMKAIGSLFGFKEPEAVKLPDVPPPAAQPIQDMKKDPTSPELGVTESALAGKKKRGKSSLKISKLGASAPSSGANIA